MARSPLGLQTACKSPPLAARRGDSCRLPEFPKGGPEPPRYCYRQPLKLEDIVTVDGRPRKIGVGCHASWPTVALRRRASWRRLQILAERTSRGRPALTLKRARRFGSPEQGSHLGGQGRDLDRGDLPYDAVVHFGIPVNPDVAERDEAGAGARPAKHPRRGCGKLCQGGQSVQEAGAQGLITGVLSPSRPSNVA